ncbi:MAG: hypothetical protein V3R66_03545, partial [Rhodospirillales bacterium]
MNLLYNNTATPDDCREVMDAAGALGIREIDFFRLAFRRWHGRKAEEKTLERAFAGYMFRQTVPAWVRHFARQVINLQERGELDAKALGAGDFRPLEAAARHAKLSLSIFAVAMIAYSLLLANVPA